MMRIIKKTVFSIGKNGTERIIKNVAKRCKVKKTQQMQ